MQANHFDTDFLPARVAGFARYTPEAVALVDASGTLGWSALWAWSGRLAHQLVTAGVKPGTRVALVLPRSAGLVASILAVWRVRACYVPLDPVLPAARLAWQAEDCGARVAVVAEGTDDNALAWLPDGIAVVAAGTSAGDVLAADFASPDETTLLDPAWPAYVIYTSGSSGRPKGVELSHGALNAYLRGVGERLPEGIRSAAYLSTPAADLGHTSLFGALRYGWTLHLIDAQTATDPDAFAAYMRAHDVDLLKIVPSHLDALLQAQSSADVLPARCLVTGGEPAPGRLAERVARLRPQCRLINHYGPTETAVGVLTHAVHAGQTLDTPTLPLGTPLAHVAARIVDTDGNTVADGVAGELCIGGASVANGYLNRPALTAERFVPDPEGNGARLYRTGDKSCRSPRGEFAFLGRIDDQVKIRGFRVEPEEVAARLRLVDGVRDAVVIARAEGEGTPLRLFGYLTAAAPLDVEAVRAVLAADLPDYMVPSSLHVLDALPLTANGKVDRAALPAIADAQACAGGGTVAPRNDAERALHAIWRAVLRREVIGVTDNFFEIGGDSILSLQIIARARRAGLKLTPKQVFAHPTIEAAARVAVAIPVAGVPAAQAAVAEAGAATASSDDDAWYVQAGVERGTVEAVYPATPMQQGLLFHGMLDGLPGLYVGQLRITVEAPRVETLRDAWQSVVDRHPVLRTRFVWPAGCEALQIVERHVPVPFEAHHGTASLWQDAYDARFDAARDELVAAGFDPACAPLMRVDVFMRPDGAADVLWTHHHALTDGWSTAQIAAEVVRAYDALAAGREPERRPGARYADYVSWLRRQPDPAPFWRTRAAALDEPARVADALGSALRASPAVACGTHHAAQRVLFVDIGARRHEALQRAAQRARITLNTLVQGAWALVLAQFSGRAQVAFGATMAGRPADLPDAQRIVGLFINSLPVWVDVPPHARLADWLAELQSRNAELREVEHTSLADLRQLTGLAGEALFDSLVVFQNYPLDDALAARGGALQVRTIDVFHRTHLPLTLVVAPRQMGGATPELSISWRWDPERIEAAALERLAQHFDRVIDQLAQALDEPGVRLRDLTGERETAPPAPAAFRFESVLARIEAQMAARGEAVALTCPLDARDSGAAGEAVSVTYRELDAWSAALARRCARAVPRGGEARIGVAMRRSPGLVAALLGVLRAGAAYVPLDPAYPDERLSDIALDAGLNALIVDGAERERFARLLPGLTLIDAENPAHAPELDEAAVTIDRTPHPGQLAYVIYTSGSTGKPKGVGVTHANVARLFDATQAQFHFDARDVWTLFHSYAFDFSVWELFGALTLGGRLVIVPHWTAREPAAFHALLR
uniref:non-ribosomal peptide synthetase n=1 Tax=Paraburkholderia phosphatilytica TaxID=2282883 RepID=UPI000E5554A8